MPISPDLAPPPALVALLETVSNLPRDKRIDHRDEVAAFGAAAVTAMQRWVAAGESPGFAIAVLEAVGRTSDRTGALAALRGIQARNLDWASIAAAAIERLERAG